MEQYSPSLTAVAPYASLFLTHSLNFLLLTSPPAWRSQGRVWFPSRGSWCPTQCPALKSREPGVGEQANQCIIKCKSSSSVVGFKHPKEMVNAKCLPSSSFSISTKHLSFQLLLEMSADSVPDPSQFLFNPHNDHTKCCILIFTYQGRNWSSAWSSQSFRKARFETGSVPFCAFPFRMLFS